MTRMWIGRLEIALSGVRPEAARAATRRLPQALAAHLAADVPTAPPPALTTRQVASPDHLAHHLAEVVAFEIASRRNRS